MNAEDVTKGLQTLSSDIEMARNEIAEIDAKKADKRDLLDQRQK